MHLAEGRNISNQDITVIEQLGENFVASFSHLYTKRHCVQVVHSVVHIAATVRDFGPLMVYSTFNVENQLGEHILLTLFWNSFFLRFRYTDAHA